MPSIYVIKIPGWRTFIVEPARISEAIENATSAIRSRFRSSIFRAIERGDSEEVLRLATPRRLSRARGQWGESPLVAAIVCGASDLACRLIELEGSFDSDGSLVHAAMRGDLKVVTALLRVKRNVDEPLANDAYNKGYTPLMWATNRKFFAVMEALLDAGANVNATAEDGSTAAIFTKDAEPNDLKALEILCQYKPDITLKDWRGRDLIQEARDRERFGGRPEMRQLLERYFPDVDFNAA